MGEWSSLLTAIGGLASALIWPAVVVVVVLLFRPQIVRVLQSDDLSLTGPGGMALVAKRKTVDATDAVMEVSRTRGDSPLTREQATAEVTETQRHLQFIEDPVVLWVDDIPSDTDQERFAMEALGISFDLSVSTDDALTKLHRRTYDAIISDMGRPPDSRAGYTLLDAVREAGDSTPLVFYTTSRAPDHFDEAVEHGALGCTNRVDELMQMVVAALKITARARPTQGLDADRAR